MNNTLTSTNAPHLIPHDRVRDIIYRLRAWADRAREQAARWEAEKNWGTAERDTQINLHRGQADGYDRASNAIGAELAKYAEDCREAKCAQKTDDEKWRDHFVLPIASEMKRRGIGELRIKLTEKGTAVFELLPENSQAQPRDSVG
jgi:hypothetical protein